MIPSRGNADAPVMQRKHRFDGIPGQASGWRDGSRMVGLK